jgi:hypothetical protein
MLNLLLKCFHRTCHSLDTGIFLNDETAADYNDSFNFILKDESNENHRVSVPSPQLNVCFHFTDRILLPVKVEHCKFKMLMKSVKIQVTSVLNVRLSA